MDDEVCKEERDEGWGCVALGFLRLMYVVTSLDCTKCSEKGGQ